MPSAPGEPDRDPEAVVLCVEPDPIIGEIVRSGVEALDCRIVLVSSAESALRELARMPHAVVVTDDDLGATRGIDLVGSIRDGRPDVEIVLLTADPSVVSLVSRLRVERLQCVKRPFGLEELREVVTRALARHRERMRAARSTPPATIGTRAQELPTGLRVLVVDDDPLVRRAMARTFRAHDVVLAENGRAATREIERKTPDLIVTDLRMPEMDGFAFADEVKQRWPELANRILFLSGTDSHIERARREVPSAPLVRKPASGEELERRMAEVLEAASFRSTPTPTR